MLKKNPVAKNLRNKIYKLRIVKAKKGKTIIFPAIWTHTHKGEITKNQEKYIITGWFNFIK